MRLLHHRGDQTLSVAPPGEAAHVVALDVHDGDAAAAAILDLQLPLIRLVPVARLRGPGEILPVRRGPRLRIVPVIARGEILRRSSSAVDQPEVAVRAPGFALRRLAADDQLAVRGEAEVVAAADAEARPVGVERGDVARRPAGGRHDQDVRALAFLPFRPVPGEEVIDDARLDAALLPLLRSLLVAGLFPGALRVDLAGEGDPAAVGRVDPGVRSAAQARDLLRVPAVQLVIPELALAHDQELLAVGRPARVLAAGIAG